MDQKDIDIILTNDIEWRRHIFNTINIIDANVRQQNGRVRSLETWKAHITGKIVGITSAISFIWMIVFAVALAIYSKSGG